MIEYKRSDLLALASVALLNNAIPFSVIWPIGHAPGLPDDITITRAEVDQDALKDGIRVRVLVVTDKEARAEVAIDLDALWRAITLHDDRGIVWRTYNRGHAWTDGRGRWWGRIEDPHSWPWAFPVGLPTKLGNSPAERNRERV